jgi:hypothetical protein
MDYPTIVDGEWYPSLKQAWRAKRLPDKSSLRQKARDELKATGRFVYDGHVFTKG